MDMSGEQRIPAPQQAVWDALFDPEVLKLCIPGCDSVEKVSDTQFTAKVVIAVGPVKAKFAGEVALEELNAPNNCTINGKGNAKVELSTEGTDPILKYTANASVGGKLAQIGARLVDSTAKKLADEFFKRFVKLMTDRAAAGA